jgi:chorismate mutase
MRCVRTCAIASDILDTFSKDQPVESDRIKFLWSRIKQHLEEEKRRIYHEIRSYPPPIPACDAQFNHLLEERRKISQELAELEHLSNQDFTPEQHIKLIDRFITSSICINNQADPEIRSRLKESLSELDKQN